LKAFVPKSREKKRKCLDNIQPLETGAFLCCKTATMKMYCIFGLFILLAGCASEEQDRESSEKAERNPYAIETVTLLPLNDIDTASLQVVKKGIQDSLGVTVHLLAARQMPANAWYAPRKRYWADSVLAWMKPLSNGIHHKVLGITGRDLSTKKGPQYNWGIMGLAMMPGSAGVISDYRLHKHGLTAAQVRYRLLKVALHELGHTAGLPHCKLPSCLMVDAEGQDKLDQEMGYCPACSQHLKRR
jgi:archaemetzincin